MPLSNICKKARLNAYILMELLICMMLISTASLILSIVSGNSINYDAFEELDRSTITFEAELKDYYEKD